jgi:hypothetical protein
LIGVIRRIIDDVAGPKGHPLLGRGYYLIIKPEYIQEVLVTQSEKFRNFASMRLSAVCCHV